MAFELFRMPGQPGWTHGSLFYNGKFICYTLEDRDRQLELGKNQKVDKLTAIPRGTYELIISDSVRFKKPLPEILNVPFFKGVRIHGGNTAADTDGCVLVGLERFEQGVRRCAPALKLVMDIIKQSKQKETITIK